MKKLILAVMVSVMAAMPGATPARATSCPMIGAIEGDYVLPGDPCNFDNPYDLDLKALTEFLDRKKQDPVPFWIPNVDPNINPHPYTGIDRFGFRLQGIGDYRSIGLN